LDCTLITFAEVFWIARQAVQSASAKFTFHHIKQLFIRKLTCVISG